MPAAFQFKCNRDERVDVAKSTNIREYNAQVNIPGSYQSPQRLG
jgi:hypothetical protein